MKRIVVLLCLMSVSARGQWTRGYMSRVEPLTPEQKRRLDQARADVDAARARLAEAERAVGKEHGFKAEEGPLWTTWVERDGDFIVLRAKNNIFYAGDK